MPQNNYIENMNSFVQRLSNETVFSPSAISLSTSSLATELDAFCDSLRRHEPQFFDTSAYQRLSNELEFIGYNTLGETRPARVENVKLKQVSNDIDILGLLNEFEKRCRTPQAIEAYSAYRITNRSSEMEVTRILREVVHTIRRIGTKESKSSSESRIFTLVSTLVGGSNVNAFLQAFTPELLK